MRDLNKKKTKSLNTSFWQSLFSIMAPIYFSLLYCIFFKNVGDHSFTALSNFWNFIIRLCLSSAIRNLFFIYLEIWKLSGLLYFWNSSFDIRCCIFCLLFKHSLDIYIFVFVWFQWFQFAVRTLGCFFC